MLNVNKHTKTQSKSTITNTQL